MRCAFLTAVLLVVLILALAGSWIAFHYGFKYWHHTENSGSTSTLSEFGDPIAHRIVGPFYVLRNQGYISGYDAGIQDPRWVETRFFSVTSPHSSGRPSEFSPDSRIELEDKVNTHYLTDTGYDRGHMAPNWGVSICYGRSAQLETFLLTNVIPQSPQLNRGLWESLEKIISNDYAERFGQVWVICGPVFPPNPETLKSGKILIPDRCYKIILRLDDSGAPRVLAFEMPQSIKRGHDQRDLIQYLTSVSRIEADTGVSFFPDLAPQLKERIDREVPVRMW